MLLDNEKVLTNCLLTIKEYDNKITNNEFINVVEQIKEHQKEELKQLEENITSSINKIKPIIENAISHKKQKPYQKIDSITSWSEPLFLDNKLRDIII